MFRRKNKNKQNYSKFEFPFGISILVFLTMLFLMIFTAAITILISTYIYSSDEMIIKNWFFWITLISIFLILYFSIFMILFSIKYYNFLILKNELNLKFFSSTINSGVNYHNKRRILITGSKGIGKTRILKKNIFPEKKPWVFKNNILSVDFSSYEIQNIESINSKIMNFTTYWKNLINFLIITFTIITAIIFGKYIFEEQSKFLLFNSILISFISFIFSLVYIIKSWKFCMCNGILFENLNRIHHVANSSLDSKDVIQMMPKIKKLKNKIIIFEHEEKKSDSEIFKKDNILNDPKYITDYIEIPNDLNFHSINLKNELVKEGIFEKENIQLDGVLRILLLKYKFNYRVLKSKLQWYFIVFKMNRIFFDRIKLNLLDLVFISEFVKAVVDDRNIEEVNNYIHFKNIDSIKNSTKKRIISTKETKSLSKLSYFSKVFSQPDFNGDSSDGETKYEVYDEIYNYKFGTESGIFKISEIFMDNLPFILNSFYNLMLSNQEIDEVFINSITSTEQFFIKTKLFSNEEYKVFFETIFSLENWEPARKIIDIVIELQKEFGDDYFDKEIIDFLTKKVNSFLPNPRLRVGIIEEGVEESIIAFLNEEKQIHLSTEMISICFDTLRHNVSENKYAMSKFLIEQLMERNNELLLNLKGKGPFEPFVILPKGPEVNVEEDPKNSYISLHNIMMFLNLKTKDLLDVKKVREMFLKNKNWFKKHLANIEILIANYDYFTFDEFCENEKYFALIDVFFHSLELTLKNSENVKNAHSIYLKIPECGILEAGLQTELFFNFDKILKDKLNFTSSSIWFDSICCLIKENINDEKWYLEYGLEEKIKKKIELNTM